MYATNAFRRNERCACDALESLRWSPFSLDMFVLAGGALRRTEAEIQKLERHLEARHMSEMKKPVLSVRPPLPVVGSTPVLSSPVVRFERLLDLHEAAAILGMHWKTLEAKARGHEVPAFKVGKRWRFRLSSLNSWLEHGINSNTTDHAGVTRQERCS